MASTNDLIMYGLAIIGISNVFSGINTLYLNYINRETIRTESWDKLELKTIIKSRSLDEYLTKQQDYISLVSKIIHANGCSSYTLKQNLMDINASVFFDKKYKMEYDICWKILIDGTVEKNVANDSQVHEVVSISCKKLKEAFPKYNFDKFCCGKCLDDHEYVIDESSENSQKIGDPPKEKKILTKITLDEALDELKKKIIV